jgi:hypothetical protein
LGVDVLDFQFELGYFGYSLGYISKYWAIFCSTFWSPSTRDKRSGVFVSGMSGKEMFLSSMSYLLFDIFLFLTIFLHRQRFQQML